MNNFFDIFLDQALCGICRENTHRAKMFASHEVLPMSKFSQEGLRKVFCGFETNKLIKNKGALSSLIPLYEYNPFPLRNFRCKKVELKFNIRAKM